MFAIDELIGGLIDLTIRTIKMLQEISGKSREEILDAIRDESAKSDELIKQLRP